MRKITIEDISRHTGLSRGTVSRALNDRPDISEETKQRVLVACRELKYVPSHAARSLATGRNYTVIVIVDNLRNMFNAAFLRGVLKRAERDRYGTYVIELGSDDALAAEQIHLGLVAERIDGVLVAAQLPPSTTETMRESLGSHPLAACWSMSGIAGDIFSPDFAEAGRLAARHLADQGCRTIAYVHEAHTPMVAERLKGFQEVCQERGLRSEVIAITGESESLPSSISQFEALAADSDTLAINLMLHCLRAGRIPGQDIAIMGQGNDPAGTTLFPNLTTIDPNGEEIGQRAMDAVLQRLGNTRQDTPQVNLISPILLPRASSLRKK